MQIEILDGVGKPLVIKASRILISADNGTPQCIAVQQQPGANEVITCVHAGEKNFRLMLQQLGIDRTVIVRKIDPPPFT